MVEVDAIYLLSAKFIKNILMTEFEGFNHFILRSFRLAKGSFSSQPPTLWMLAQSGVMIKILDPKQLTERLKQTYIIPQNIE